MHWKNKVVLVTGICGTIGRELLRQLCVLPVKEIIGIDNNESELFFCAEQYKGYERISFSLTDIVSYRNLVGLFEGVDIVIHAAALKHVHLCEQTPSSAIETNINGTQNVIDAALHCGVGRVVFTSSDKAVNPTNVMGTTKLMGERLITAANVQRENKKTIFLSTRFGNVLGSRGSVIPLFKEQIRKGGPITLTDESMTRFIMSCADAVKLIMDSIFHAYGGEVFVTKMPTIRITDLAKVLIDKLAPEYGFISNNIEIKKIGVKPGEKMYEELINHEEIRRTVEIDEYFIVKPAFYDLFSDIKYDYEKIKKTGVSSPYNSSGEKPMTEEALTDYLLLHKLI